MTKKRHNIDTIAEILIDKINDLEKHTNRIENVVKDVQTSSIDVDTSEIENLYNIRQKQERQFLSDLKALNLKNKTRLPNYILIALLITFVALVGFSLYSYKQLKQVDVLKLQIEYYEDKLKQ